MDWNVVAHAIPLLADAAVVTIQIACLAGVLEVFLGLVIGLLSLSNARIVRIPVAFYVDVIRGTPLIVQIFFVYFALPSIGVNLPEFWAGVIALSFNGAAFVAETVRGGIASVERGQSEAAQSIGMRRSQVLVWILLPQVLRQILPPVTNELINLTKNTSLLSAISVFELTRSAQSLVSTYFTPLEIYGLLAIYYYVIVKVLSVASMQLERRLPRW